MIFHSHIKHRYVLFNTEPVHYPHVCSVYFRSPTTWSRFRVAISVHIIMAFELSISYQKWQWKVINWLCCNGGNIWEHINFSTCHMLKWQFVTLFLLFTSLSRWFILIKHFQLCICFELNCPHPPHVINNDRSLNYHRIQVIKQWNWLTMQNVLGELIWTN